MGHFLEGTIFVNVFCIMVGMLKIFYNLAGIMDCIYINT